MKMTGKKCIFGVYQDLTHAVLKCPMLRTDFCLIKSSVVTFLKFLMTFE